MDRYIFNYLLPGEVGRVAVGDDLDDLAVDGDAVGADGLDVGVEDAERGVVFEEVGGLLHASGVVDGNDIQRGVLSPMPAPQEVPPNPTESIDCHFQLRLNHSPLVLPTTDLFPHTHTHSSFIIHVRTHAIYIHIV